MLTVSNIARSHKAHQVTAAGQSILSKAYEAYTEDFGEHEILLDKDNWCQQKIMNCHQFQYVSLHLNLKHSQRKKKAEYQIIAKLLKSIQQVIHVWAIYVACQTCEGDLDTFSSMTTSLCLHHCPTWGASIKVHSQISLARKHVSLPLQPVLQCKMYKGKSMWHMK